MTDFERDVVHRLADHHARVAYLEKFRDDHVEEHSRIWQAIFKSARINWKTIGAMAATTSAIVAASKYLGG